MKHVFVVSLIVMVSLASCAINGKNKMAEETKASSFQPKPLDDDWSKWLVGEPPRSHVKNKTGCYDRN